MICFKRIVPVKVAMAIAPGLLLASSLVAQAEVSVGQPKHSANLISQITETTQHNGTLPERVERRVLRYAADDLGISRRDLRVVNASQEIWSDGCLGIPSPVELCLAAQVPGWRVEVTDGQQRWAYRTDATAKAIRRERDANSGEALPSAVRDRVLQAAARQSGLPASQLRVVDARSQVWDGCFGFDPGFNGACTEIAISGWQVIVAGDGQTLVYHTNEEGTDIRLNEAASQLDETDAIIPTFIGSDELPPALDTTEVFRSIASGGIAGGTSEVVLYADGRVVRMESARPGTQPTLITRISAQQVEQFQQQLGELKFLNFNGLNYPASEGAADYITVTLSSNGGTTQYADIVSDRLPIALQNVIQAWDQIVQSPPVLPD